MQATENGQQKLSVEFYVVTVVRDPSAAPEEGFSVAFMPTTFTALNVEKAFVSAPLAIKLSRPSVALAGLSTVTSHLGDALGDLLMTELEEVLPSDRAVRGMPA